MERKVTSDFGHRPVLLEATVAGLEPVNGGRYLDGTLGGGGHSAALLDAAGPDGIVVGIDRDPAALAAARARLKPFGDRFTALHGTFDQMAALAADWAPFDGILLDLGVSSPQLDKPERGFSFQSDGPVDMRMDPTQDLDATQLLAGLDERGLAEILRRYGEEPRARRIARAILEGRPWESTLSLARCIADASGYRNSRTHPATRTFQALRIAVNDELGQLERAIAIAVGMLRPNGRLAIITFHSLEDRLVKRTFRILSGHGTAKDPYGNPVIAPKYRLVHRRGIAGKDADAGHPRSRSARLRILEHLPAESPL